MVHELLCASNALTRRVPCFGCSVADEATRGLYVKKGDTTVMRVHDDGVWVRTNGLTVGNITVQQAILALSDRVAALEAQQASQPAAADSTAVIKDGLIAHWTFEGGCVGEAPIVDDLSAHGNDLTVTDGACTYDGHRGKGWRFYGWRLPQLARAALNGFDGGSTAITVAGWWRLLRRDGDSGVFGVGSTALRHHLYLRAFIGCDGNRVAIGADSGSSDLWHCSDSNPAVPTDVWTHYTVTYEGTSVKVYINGNLGVSTTLAAPLELPRNIMLGSDGHNDNRFDGIMDEVYAYNRVLSASEVSTLYEAESLSPYVLRADVTDIEAGRIALFRFDDCATAGASSTADASGWGNDISSAVDGGCDLTGGRSGGAGWKLNGGADKKGSVQTAVALNGYDGGTLSAGITLVTWVKVLANKCSTCSGAGIFGMGSSASTKHMYLRIQFSGADDYSIGADDNGSDLWHNMASGSSQLNEWKHVAMAYTGTALYLWLDGVQYTKSLHVDQLRLTNLLQIGSDGHFDNPISAIYDNFMVYKRVLTTNEIDVLRAQAP